MASNLTNKPNATPKFSVAIKSEAYQQLINNTLGDPKVAMKFVADISSVVANNSMLAACDAKTILSAGLTAQTLNLPLAQSLGYAYIVPYAGKAQFQIGWKGLVQLAMRSGQFEKLGVKEVHEGEWIGLDEDGDDIIKFNHEYDLKPVIGYYAYFKLLNGFRKSLYWTVQKCEAHGSLYSQAHSGKARGGAYDNWTKNFDAMASKTVLKQLLSKFAPMSVELETGILKDQMVFGKDGKGGYNDNPSYVEQDNDEFEDEKKNTSVSNRLFAEEDANEYAEYDELGLKSEE